MSASVKTLMADLSQGHARFGASASELRTHLVDCQQQWFAEWKEHVESELRDETSGLALQLQGRLMEVEKDDLTLRVNYSDRLVQASASSPPHMKIHQDSSGFIRIHQRGASTTRTASCRRAPAVLLI